MEGEVTRARLGRGDRAARDWLEGKHCQRCPLPPQSREEEETNLSITLRNNESFDLLLTLLLNFINLLIFLILSEMD